MQKQSATLCVPQRMGHPGSPSYSRVNTISGIIGARYLKEEKNPKGCATLYDGVGSVKRHLECASFVGSFFVFPSKKIFSLSRMPTKARS